MHLFDMRIVIISIILCFLYACQPQAEQIVQRSIVAHGLDQLQTLDSLSYQKTTQVYDSTGKVTKTIDQDHTIYWNPFIYEIRTPGDSTLQVYRQIEDQVEVEQFGAIIQDTLLLQKAETALATAYFVFWQPFKLDDPKAVFTYAGTETLFNGEIVHAVEVAYPNDPSTDEWAFLFDVDSYLNLGYRVRHNDKLSLIINESFTERGGMPIVVEKRSSYLVLEDLDSIRIQADYQYDLN